MVASFGHYLRAKRVSETNYDLDILIDGELAKTVHIELQSVTIGRQVNEFRVGVAKGAALRGC